MTPRERVMTVLRDGIPDAVPWFTDLTYYQHGRAGIGMLDKKYLGAEGLFQLHQDLRVGVYLFTPGLVSIDREADLFHSTHEEYDDTRTRHTFFSPEGTLTSVTQRCDDSSSAAIVEYPVKTADDLRVVEAWYRGATYRPNYDAVIACDAHWGDFGLGVPLTPRTPLAALVAEWCGVKNLSYLVADAPDAVEHALEVMRNAEDELYRLTCAAPYPVVEIPDNLTAEAVGGMWRKYSRAYYEKRVAELHASGKLVGCHIDGTLGHLLGDLVAAGIDFPESVVPSPVGDLSLEEIRATVKPETIIWGCVPSAMFAPPFDPDWVLAFVREVVQVVGVRGRLVLAGADQVPPNGNIDLVRRIGDLLEEIGPPA